MSRILDAAGKSNMILPEHHTVWTYCPWCGKELAFWLCQTNKQNEILELIERWRYLAKENRILHDKDNVDNCSIMAADILEDCASRIENSLKGKGLL